MMPREFLKELHYFRAFAIISIVAAHTFFMPEQYQHSTPYAYNIVNAIRETLFRDSTMYFLFISGFLFHHLHKEKINPFKYYKNKLLFIFIPYTILSIFIIILSTLPELSLNNLSYSVKNIYWRMLVEIPNGQVEATYWYIIFILPVFAISPLLLRLPKNTFKIITLSASLLPLLGTRTGTEVTLGQYAYFLPVYLIGVLSSMEYRSLKAIIISTKPHIVLFSTILTIALFTLWLTGGGMNFTIKIESIYYLQKLSIILLALLLFNHLKIDPPHIINKVATYSFAIYFIHMLIDRLVNPIIFYLDFQNELLLAVLPLLRTTLVLAFSVIAIDNVKKLTGKYSRYILGA